MVAATKGAPSKPDIPRFMSSMTLESDVRAERCSLTIPRSPGVSTIHPIRSPMRHYVTCRKDCRDAAPAARPATKRAAGSGGAHRGRDSQNAEQTACDVTWIARLV